MLFSVPRITVLVALLFACRRSNAAVIQKRASTPTTPEEVVSSAAAAAKTSSTSTTDLIAAYNNAGLNPLQLSILYPFVDGGINSNLNINLKPATSTIYPKKSSKDAPYSVLEATLRAAIYIPSGFTYGKKTPVILVPGTGAPGGLTYEGNFAKLLSGTSYADPLWLNIPTDTLQDAQVNSEYVAYAINYISSISGQKKVAVISWSQGGLNTQWALKYWPSTQSVVSNFIAISPDLHGTVLAPLVAPLNIGDPSVLQQEYNSKFISTLRSGGGDSAYVPTTTVYSAADEVVQPQSGSTASAIILDARNVGVTNNQVQLVCPGQPAGGIYTHEGVLYNPIAYALTVDALKNGGPGQVSRITNLSSYCAEFAAPGLDVADLLQTENAIVAAAVNLLIYPGKVAGEPSISSYAS
jgi:triacylglycerol esterase/lipase EstA (alpha/beta hydrolase family)